MLKIRLQRAGRRNDPTFRVVVTEHTHGPKSQKHADRVGFYNPKTKEKELDAERITYWINNGAQPSPTVHNMLVKAGIIKGETINVLPQKSPVVSEEEQQEAEEVAAAESEAAPAAEGSDTSEEPAAEQTEEEQPAAEETPKATEEEPAEAPAEEAAEEEKKEG